MPIHGHQIPPSQLLTTPSNYQKSLFQFLLFYQIYQPVFNFNFFYFFIYFLVKARPFSWRRSSLLIHGPLFLKVIERDWIWSLLIFFIWRVCFTWSVFRDNYLLNIFFLENFLILYNMFDNDFSKYFKFKKCF